MILGPWKGREENEYLADSPVPGVIFCMCWYLFWRSLFIFESAAGAVVDSTLGYSLASDGVWMVSGLIVAAT